MEGQQEFITLVTNIVYSILNKENLLKGQWRLGKVESVLSNVSLRLYVDNSEMVQTAPCNPDINFVAGDEVIVLYINGNTKDKFVMCKRAIDSVSSGGFVYTISGELISNNNGNEVFA